jgi:hypothetical protein
MSFKVYNKKYRPTLTPVLEANIKETGRWTVNKANRWYEQQGWITGCNFIPSNAINQLEMWQKETFDAFTIDKELSWAASIGFNSVRVFLHSLLWEQDADGFLKRMDHYLAIANRYGIKTMFVLFDSVWNPYPHIGKQPMPGYGVHNSGWVQSPGADVLKDPARYDVLKGYVQGVIGHFKDDQRVQVWDLFNEPDNMNLASYNDSYKVPKGELAIQLLKKTFKWAREIRPIQPLTAAPWQDSWSDPATISEIDEYMLNNSDVITFHCYNKKEDVEMRIDKLMQYNRPILCTEYMARPFGNTFENMLPLFKDYHVGAYNWGLVAGKTQTQFSWDSWLTQYDAQPSLWFHDIFKSNGEPHDETEVAFIKEMTEVVVEIDYREVA